MDKPTILKFWQSFFADLFLGTFKKLFLFSLMGIMLGLLALFIFKSTMVADLDWDGWVKTLVLIVFFFWFGGFGVLHGLLHAVILIAEKKFIEAVLGLHDLLDLFTREVIARIPKFNKNTPKEELSRQFDNIGKDFQQKLRLKGIIGWVSSLFFWVLLKALKILFLDSVAEELLKNPSDQLSSSDIEHAVRRVGVEIILAPITDSLFLFQILNGVLIILSFIVPFGIFWLL
ncbi:MAG: hypothetical protein O3A78_12540 [Nitrospinae bacterium]|nr:hypothetical protein [Nitrospinota bacterium]MDA1110615.1 hypothetical protein [Nitrospinota bacterium]